MSKVITFELGTKSINQAIRQLNAYKTELETKTERLRELIAERIAWSASNGFSTAIADDIFTGEGDRPTGDVQVSVDHKGDVSVVIADGNDAVFIEFGAGVYYNGSAGSSPHPKGAENNFLIGEYGKGQGKRKAWALPGSTNGNPILTHGTPAAMPMYRGVVEVTNMIGELAREVFGSD